MDTLPSPRSSQTSEATPPNPELAALPDLFLLNPKNRAFIDGKAQFIAGGCSVTGLVFFFVVFVPLTIFVGYLTFLEIALYTSGITTEGVVMGKETRSDEGGGTYYRVGYSYFIDDEAYYTENSVDSSVDESIQMGSSVQVVYVPSNPYRTSLNSLSSSPFMAIYILLLMFVGFIGGMLIASVVFRRSRKRVRYLSTGQLITGQVDGWFLQEVNGGEDPDYFRCFLDYTFDSPTGHHFHGRTTTNITVSDPKDFTLHHRKPTLAILFVDDNTFKVL